MPRKRLVIPVFETEAAEADWWYRHRREVEADLRRRMREGSTLTLAQVLARARRKKDLPQPVTVRLTSNEGEGVKTQREAIEHAKHLNPNNHPDLERVRNTERGSRDKWRS